jgi:hypothetical protein
MNSRALITALNACCFKDDCPLKDLETALLAEAANRLQHPASGSLRRWWDSRPAALAELEISGLRNKAWHLIEDTPAFPPSQKRFQVGRMPPQLP